MPSESSSAVLFPDLAFEAAAQGRGALRVCGVDEAGRGPLAGPVVVAAVVLNPLRVPAGLNDSKQLSAKARERLHAEILATADVAIAVAPPRLIARLNILHATMWAMRQAVLSLARRPDHVLVDGNRLPRGLPVSAEAIVSGDARSVSIAAASIIAKVTRDRMCGVMHAEEPQFGFLSHKGYGAAAHLKALEIHGPGRHHRMDFAPCAAALARRNGTDA
jgi:ribonuclease HII